jgi:hypothetical protein
MSIEYLNRALKVEGLTPTKKFILVILCNYADESGSCYPSYSHIAKIVGLKTNKGVRLAIKEFEELGFLRIEHRIADHGGYTSNRYHLLLDRISDDPSISVSPRVGSSEINNTKEDTKTNEEEDFVKFWKIYPRKVGRKTASKSFYKFDEKHFGKILYGVHMFARDCVGKEEKYIPHPSTWLNQERWLDYFELDEVGNVIAPKKQNQKLTQNQIAG